ncbi:MAG: biotin--[acetyl-CoA-carboxylase] ligase [Flavobacteriaceae bacterium]
MSYFKINKIDAIDSTNEALKKQYHQGELLHGDLLWAFDQVKGKGQSDRQWLSEPKKNLTFSFFLNADNLSLSTVFVLNCWVALALKSALNSFGIPAVSIKWPNDIMSENKKICGILIENIYRGSKHAGSIVGIGLNVNQINFPNLAQASSMRLSSGRIFDLEEVIHTLLHHLAKYFSSQMTPKESFAAFNAALFGLHQQRTFIKEGKSFIASVQSVNEQGELILKTEDQKELYFQNKGIEWVY